MLAYRLSIVLCSLLMVFVTSSIASADDRVMPPPEHDGNKVLTEKNAARHVAVEPEAVDLKKELVPDNIGKDVQIRAYVRKTDQAKVSEYSMHGRVYMVKVQPAGNTPAYYLYDEDGDGNFSKRLPANYKRLNPPVWVLKKF